ncbi:hypothetical protein CHISP_2810 [Chitinispirillum alkaliphilum]|nr:hypothetical protein CHISP_2810 [Chitinispirillum alkaliphilum]
MFSRFKKKHQLTAILGEGKTDFSPPLTTSFLFVQLFYIHRFNSSDPLWAAYLLLI